MMDEMKQYKAKILDHRATADRAFKIFQDALYSFKESTETMDEAQMEAFRGRVHDSIDAWLDAVTSTQIEINRMRDAILNHKRKP